MKKPLIDSGVLKDTNKENHLDINNDENTSSSRLSFHADHTDCDGDTDNFVNFPNNTFNDSTSNITNKSTTI